MIAWRERQISNHLSQLAAVRDGTTGAAVDKLEAVLVASAGSPAGITTPSFPTLLHHGEHVDRAQRHLRKLVADLIAEGVRDGELRDDVPPRNSPRSACTRSPRPAA